MSTTVEKISSNKVKLSFDIDAAQFDAAMDKAYIKVRGQVTIPGFRKGRAPRKMIENMYGGEGVFYDEAFELIFDEVYGPAIDENKLEVVDRPQVDIQQIGTGKNLQFTCEVFVKPDVTLGEYKGVEVKREHTLVTEDEVNAEIEKERNKQAAEVSVEDRAVAEGDTVNLDYSGSVDGVKFAGGTAEAQTLKIGSHTFIPGFEEQMVGMNIGEEKDLEVTFPQEYHAEELAGKAATFKVKLHEVKTKELPAADDEFAKDVSEYDTLDELKASIRKGMEEQNEKNAELEVENDLVEQIVATLEGDIPPVMFETRIDEMVRDFEYRLQQQGLRLEDYIKYMGGDTAKFREGFKEQAEKQVKIRLALEAVAAAEGIAASEEDFENEVKRIADAYKMEVEKVRGIVPEAEVKKDLAVNKAIDFIKQNADVTVENVAPQKDEKAE